jgi:exopolysaccharide biosynthesis polyprenyl glycosylphosphotransferase
MLTPEPAVLPDSALDCYGPVVATAVDTAGLALHRIQAAATDLVRTGLAPLSDVSTEVASSVRTTASPRWLRRYVAALVLLDTVALLMGGLTGQLVRFNGLDGAVHGVAYGSLVLATLPIWLLALATARTYEGRFLGLGSDEFRRVVNAAAHFTALLAVLVFISRWDVARGLVVVALPLATVLALAFRFAARKVLHRLRREGAAQHRVLVVGEGPALSVLTSRLTAASYSGLAVVGTCPPPSATARIEDDVRHIRAHVAALGVNAVAVAHSPDVGPDALRRLAWSLEGTGVDLLVAPALTDVAGPRVHVRPVSGLPLLQVSEPEFSGAKRVAKGILDRAGAALALLVASPLLVGIAAVVRATSPGPVLFRQVRIGHGGREFMIYKFRSMHADAEARLEELRAQNDHGDGVLFKMRDDPRITWLGRYLRRYSLDELPQLLNVLLGSMSLVGPRPPLPSEVARYAEEAYRRLLVKPGITGLWQVSGRSDLDWEETVRLDLYYVENWSVALDGEILWKTLSAVLRGPGAR